MNLERRAGHHPRRRRRERRRQIDADEGAGRRRPARRRRDPARRRGRSPSTRPNAARARGIGIVYQELSLFPAALGAGQSLRQPRADAPRAWSRRGAWRSRAAICSTSSACTSMSTRPVSRLSIGEQQLVELCRVLLEEPRLLILDEPNSALNERETERLFAVLRQLARARHHHALRLASAGGGVRDLRPRHRHPQRPRRADRATARR